MIGFDVGSVFPGGLPIGTILAGPKDRYPTNLPRVVTPSLSFDLGAARPSVGWTTAGLDPGAFMVATIFFPANTGGMIRTVSHAFPSIMAIVSDVSRLGPVSKTFSVLTPCTGGLMSDTALSVTRQYPRGGVSAPDPWFLGAAPFLVAGARNAKHTLIIPPDVNPRLFRALIALNSAASGAGTVAISKTEAAAPPRLEVYLSEAQLGQFGPSTDPALIPFSLSRMVREVTLGELIALVGFDPSTGAGPFNPVQLTYGLGMLDANYANQTPQLFLATFGADVTPGGYPTAQFGRYQSSFVDGFVYLPQSYPLIGDIDHTTGAPAYPGAVVL